VDRDERPAVVYVDDEAMNLRVFEANFRRQFRLHTFSSGEEALAALPQLGDVGVLLSDQRMPDMSGVEVLARSREVIPDAQRMLVTAYSDVEAVIDAVNRGQVSRYFVKPWSRDDLATAIEDALRIYSLQCKVRKMEAQVLQNERLAALGQVSAGIAHELMNPVSYISQNVQLLRGELDTLAAFVRARLTTSPDAMVSRVLDELPQILTDIETGGAHIRQVALGIRSQARGEAGEEARADVADVAAFAVKLSRAEMRQKAKIVTDAHPLEVQMGPVALCQVLLNLLVNAAHAMGERERAGLIEVRWRALGGQARIDVIDNGCGIPEELQEKVFEPLFTTKPPGQGTGLGLPICRDLVRRNGGDITLTSRPGVGTTVHITLPVP
jgi:two-component system NtrC family sensor kinase